MKPILISSLIGFGVFVGFWVVASGSLFFFTGGIRIGPAIGFPLFVLSHVAVSGFVCFAYTKFSGRDIDVKKSAPS